MSQKNIEIPTDQNNNKKKPIFLKIEKLKDEEEIIIIASKETINSTKIEEKCDLKQSITNLDKNLENEINNLGSYSKFKKLKNFVNLILQFYLPIFFSFPLVILLKYIDLWVGCELDTFPKLIYRNLKDIIFILSFFPILGYKMIFPWILNKMPENKKRCIQVIIALGFLLIITPFPTLLDSGILKNHILMHVSNFIWGIAIAFLLCLAYKINFSEIRPFLSILVAFLVAETLNQYLFKEIVIIQLRETDFFDVHNKTFRVGIFVYFQIYYSFVDYLLMKFFALSENIKTSNDSILIFLKYFISDLICSSIVTPIFENVESSNRILSFFFYAYQLIIFYKRKNYFADLLWKVFNFIFKRNKIVKEKDKIENLLQKKCKMLISGSLNEIMMVVFFKIVMLSVFRKFSFHSPFLLKLADKCLFFNPENMNLLPCCLGIAFLINIIVFCLTFLKKKKRDERMLEYIKFSDGGFLMRVYHLIIMSYYVEFYLQFFFFLL